MMMLIHDDQSASSASSSGKEKYLHIEAVFSQWEKSQLNGEYFVKVDTKYVPTKKFHDCIGGSNAVGQRQRK